MLSVQQRPQAQAEAAADSCTPHALDVSCNGNYGRYLLDERAVQCLCASCNSKRSSDPCGGVWLVSPTEFERHSGMSTAKKWRTR
jgi:hypothetical protein